MTPLAIPRPIRYTLVISALVLGLWPLRAGHALGDWLHVFGQWALLLGAIPLGVMALALPLKWRDPEFDLRNAYWMGLFVAGLVSLQMLRYQHEGVSWLQPTARELEQPSASRPAP